jgi:hypothetical protein
MFSRVNCSADSVCFCLSFLFLLACLCFELLSLFLSLQSCNWRLNAGVVSNFREEEGLAFERAVAAFGRTRYLGF